MIRVGFYTGNTYSQEDYDNHTIKECCIAVSPSSDSNESLNLAKDEALYKRITQCGSCHQCEASKN